MHFNSKNIPQIQNNRGDHTKTGVTCVAHSLTPHFYRLTSVTFISNLCYTKNQKLELMGLLRDFKKMKCYKC